jgi:hypothetical protein
MEKKTVPVVFICICPCRSQSRKLKSRHGARNRFQETSLELKSKLHRLAGRYDNPLPTWFLALIAGLKLPTLESEFLNF